MKKITLILLLFFNYLIAFDSKSDIPNGKYMFVFEKEGCPYCKKFKPEAERFSKQFGYELIIVRKGSKLFKSLKEDFEIMFYPTSYLLLKNGEELDYEAEFFGYQPYEEMKHYMLEEDI